MENIQNIGKSFLFYSFLKRFKTSILDVQIYYPEIIALSSDILISKISETMKSLDELHKEPEIIDQISISQLYYSFEKCLTESQYIQRLATCFDEFSHSKNHPINQLSFLPISQEIKNQIQDILKKSSENENDDKTTFTIYNSNDNIYQKKCKKVKVYDEISKLLTSNNYSDISVNFNSSLLQLQKMIDIKTVIQKIFQMKPFFNKKNIKLDETQSIANELSDSEMESEYSGSESGSEADLKPVPDIKINEIPNENDKTNISENENSNYSHDEHSIKLKIELDSALTSLKSAMSENVCLKTKIDKLMIEKIELNEQLQDIEKLRKEQIKAVEENALLKIENEKLKNGDDDNSSSFISLVIASSSNLNNIKLQSSREAIVFNEKETKSPKESKDLKDNNNTIIEEKDNKNNTIIHCSVKEETNQTNTENTKTVNEIESTNKNEDKSNNVEKKVENVTLEGNNSESNKEEGKSKIDDNNSESKKEEEKAKIDNINSAKQIEDDKSKINEKNSESKKEDDKSKINEKNSESKKEDEKAKINEKNPEPKKEEGKVKIDDKTLKTPTEQKKETPKKSFGKNVLESLKRLHFKS